MDEQTIISMTTEPKTTVKGAKGLITRKSFREPVLKELFQQSP